MVVIHYILLTCKSDANLRSRIALRMPNPEMALRKRETDLSMTIVAEQRKPAEIQV